MWSLVLYLLVVSWLLCCDRLLGGLLVWLCNLFVGLLAILFACAARFACCLCSFVCVCLFLGVVCVCVCVCLFARSLVFVPAWMEGWLVVCFFVLVVADSYLFEGLRVWLLVCLCVCLFDR